MENFIARKYLNYTKIKRIYLSYINNTKKKKKQFPSSYMGRIQFPFPLEGDNNSGTPFQLF
jgi:hypothetical protein